MPAAPTRTVAQIVRSNVFTRFNALLGAMLVLILFVGPVQDALFGVVLVANTMIGIVQELRAKRTLDRLTLLTAPTATVVRDGEASRLAPSAIVRDDVLELAPGDQVVVDGVVLSSERLEIDESLLTGESEPVVKAPGDRVLSGSFVAAGTGRVQVDRRRRRGVRRADRRGRPPVHADDVGAPQRDRPDPDLRDVGDRPDRRAAVRQPVPRGARAASGLVGRGRRHRRDGAGGPRPADVDRVLGRGRAARAASGARAGAPRRRGPRARRRAVHRQDRHAHRGPARARARRASRRGPGPGARPRGARGRRSGAERHAPRDRRGAHRTRRWLDAGGRGAVLVGAQVERRRVRRARRVDPRRAGCARPTTPRPSSGSRRTPTPARGWCCSHAPARSRATTCPPTVARWRSSSSSRPGPARRGRHAALLRRAGRACEGHQRRRPVHGRGDRVLPRPRRRRGSRRCADAAGGSGRARRRAREPIACSGA